MFSNKWQALSMSERAFLIREAVRNGITDIDSIRDTWEHRFDGESSQPTDEKPWYKKLASAISEGARMARDARIGAVGAEQIRQLYREGKAEEAQELAKQYAKANIAGMAMAAGAANTAGLVGDLGITGVSTLVDTAIEGNADNIVRDLGINTVFDIVGHGAGKVSNLIKSGIKNTRYNISLEDALKSGIVPDDKKSFFEIMLRKRPEVAEKMWAREVRKSPGPVIDRSKLYYNKEWYKSRLQNKGYSEAKIEEILQHFDTMLDQVDGVSFADLQNEYLGLTKSTSAGKNVQHILLSHKLKEDPLLSKALDDIFTHEVVHATSFTGNKLPAGIDNSSIFLTPNFERDINPQLFDYYSVPDEQRVRLLAFADFAETKFGGDYDKAYQFISDTQRGNWLSKDKTYINPDLTDLVRVFKKEDVINGAKNVLSISPIIGLNKENSLQWKKEYREKYGHQFSGKGIPYTTDSNNETDSSFIEKLAYNIGSVPSAKDAGEGDFGDILEGVFNAITNRDPYKYDDLKAFLGHPEDYGFKPSSDTRGPQFGDVISKYKNKNIKTYQGNINPFNEYVVTQEDYNKFFDMATKGEIFYSNADGEYFDYYYKGNPDNMLDKDTAHFLHTPYRNDSHDYPIEFVIKDGNLYANAADFYDFSANKGDGLKKRIQARLLTRYGKPYIVRQNMIPVRAIDLPEEFLGLPTLDYKGNSSNMDLTEEQKRARNMHRNLEVFESEK